MSRWLVPPRRNCSSRRLSTCPPHKPHLASCAGYRQGDDDIVHAAAEQCDEREGEQDRGEGEQSVHDAHQYVVEETEVTREECDYQPENDRDNGYGESDI